MNKNFEEIFQKACDYEHVAPFEGILSHLLGKDYNDCNEAIVVAFLSGIMYAQEEAKGGRLDG